jgi:hypothetical protein
METCSVLINGGQETAVLDLSWWLVNNPDWQVKSGSLIAWRLATVRIEVPNWQLLSAADVRVY